MNKFYTILLAAIASLFALSVNAQQLPDPGFESWSKNFNDSKDGNMPQLANWQPSNVTQSALGIEFRFNLLHKEAGHTGSCAMVMNREVGAAGIVEIAPAYFSTGQTWQFLNGLEVTKATAGTSGGVNFTYRPDSMEVWIKRTGDHWNDEDFHILFYAWKGHSVGRTYQGKDGTCTDISVKSETEKYRYDEESDIRQALDANKCGIEDPATQIAEGWLRDRKEYGDWTKITIPIFYASDEKPEMCNVIFSSSNYPNFRANTGLFVGNALYVDDVRLIYTSKIDKLYIGGKEWKGFNPNSSEVQTFSVGKTATSIPEIYGMRGAGKLTNARGASANFFGRRLSASEMKITQAGEIDKTPTIIEVTAEANDGVSPQTTTYKIQFVSVQSSNARLASISVNDEPLAGFNGYLGNYNVELPYGTTKAPVVTIDKSEDAQEVKITQATSPTGKATITVTAQDGKTTMTYTLNFSVAKLSDTTLEAIYIDGDLIVGFLSTKRNYTIELPLETTAAPKITWKSAYKQGEQTITLKQNDLSSGAQIVVSAPGATKDNTYKITYKITASTYSLLKDLRVGGKTVDDFNPERKDYYINLSMGTTSLPEIAYTQGDKYQTVAIDKGGIDGVTKITVTAASGAQTIYRLNFSVEKSSNVNLKAINLNGKLIDGFDPETYEYVISLGTGVTVAPTVTYTKGDEYQTVEVRDGGLTGTTRIIVTAGDGSSQAYTIRYTQTLSTVNTLKMIYVGGQKLAGFSANKLEYDYQLPQGTTTLPAVTFDKGDDAQTVTPRTFSGLTGDYKLAVKPQSGATQTYIIHFSVLTSSNVNLRMIYVNGKQLEGFSSANTSYSVTLPMGTTSMPKLTWDLGDSSQKVIYTEGSLNGSPSQLLVRAEDGSTNTYKVSFTVPVAGVSTLLDIKVGGVTLEGFSPDKTEYSVSLPQGTTTLPAITYTQNDEYQTVRKTEAGVNGDTRIIVRAQNGNTTTYIIHFSVLKSTSVALAGISVGGKPLAAFRPDRLSYDTILPAGTTRVPSVTYTKGASSQTVYVTNGSFTTPTTLRVVAEDGSSQTYSISFSVVHSENAYLNMIYLDSVALEGFSPERMEYSYNLSSEATSCPVITVEKNEGQRVSITMPLLTGTASILVEPETGEPNIYTVRFTQAASTNSQLRAIYLDGVQLENFMPEQTEYDVTLAPTATAVPNITYDVADEYQRVFLTLGSLTDKSYIKVVAADDTYTVYTLSFTRRAAEASDESTLASIRLNGNDIADFSAEQTSYTYMLPDGTTAAPAISAVKAGQNETVVIVQPTGVGEATVEVTSEDQSQTTTYHLDIQSNQSSNALLADLQLDGVSVVGFDPEVFVYTVDLPNTTIAAPAITGIKGDAAQQVSVVSNGLNATSFVSVVAQDGTRNVYSVQLDVAKSPDALLAGISIDGISLAGFDANVFDYNYELALGVAKLGDVTVTKAHPGQHVVVRMPNRDGVGTIVVTSEDGQNTNTYTLNVTAELSHNAELSEIVVNGVSLLTSKKYAKGNVKAKAKANDMVIHIPAFSTPKISYTEGEARQTIGFVDNGDKGAVIIVTAEDGITTNEYNISYIIDPSDDVLLADLLVFNGTTFSSIEGFDAETTEYTVQLPWRTVCVPVLWAVANSKGQTIEIDYGAVNEQTIIKVTAQDGVHSKTYKVNFPVDKSSNTLLEDVVCDIADVNFSPDENVYTLELPYKTDMAPMLTYTKAEPEQKVIYTYAPLTEKSTIRVIAEDGSEKTYEFRFTVLKSDNPNTLPMVNVNGQGYLLGDVSSIDIPLPYGTTDFVVEVPQKSYDEQTVHILNGGLRHPTTITVYPNRDSEAAKVYTLNPVLDETYPTALTAITIDGTPIANFSPDKHVYLVAVDDEPAEVVGTAYNAAMTVDNEAIHFAKQRRIVVEDPLGEYDQSVYDVYFYYQNDLNFDLSFDNFDDVTNTLKGAGLMDMTDMVKEATGISSLEVNIGNFNDHTYTGYSPHNWNTLMTANTTGLKDKDDMGYIKFSFFPKLNISSVIGGVITDYSPLNFVSRSEGQKAEGKYSLGLSTAYLTTSAESLPSALSLSKQSVGIGMWMLDGVFPSWLKFGSMSPSEMLAAASAPTTLNFGEPIIFRNSPDKFSVKIKPHTHNSAENAVDGKRFVENWTVSYIVNGEDFVAYKGNFNSTAWQTVEKEFSYVENPMFLDIRINSAGTESPHDMYVKNAGSNASNQCTSTIYVDEMQLLYRSDLIGMKVNGMDATMSGTDFTVNLLADDYYGVPRLEFSAGVPDQEQRVTWNTDYTEAEIVNYAEDLTTTTTYHLTINRTVSSNNYLSKLYIGGTEYPIFSPTTTEYTITYDGEMPDLQAVVKSAHSTATMATADGKTVVIVKAENNDLRTYTITWQKNSAVPSNDASFTVTKAGAANPATETFVTLVKTYDAQTIVFDETLGTIVCTASDGTSQQTKSIADYIDAPAVVTTDAQLAQLANADVTVYGFASATYSYTGEAGMQFAFERNFAGDHVVETITDDLTTITLTGSGAVAPDENATHTYSVTTEAEKSDNAFLLSLLIDGVEIEGFYEGETEYTIQNLFPKVEALRGDDGQTVTIEYINGNKQQSARRRAPRKAPLDDKIKGTYVINITSENGLETHEVRVFLEYTSSSDATLSNLAVDGLSLSPAFTPSCLAYTVSMPVPQPKLEKSLMPSLQVTAGSAGQTIEVEENGVNAISYVIVTAQNGSDQQIYEVSIEQPASSYSKLDMLEVNGEQVVLQDGVFEYEVMLKTLGAPTVNTYCADKFALVMQSVSETQAVIEVTAEDGSMSQYTVNFTLDPSLADADLQSIKLDGVQIPDFAPSRTSYYVELPIETESLPIINITKKYAAQTVYVSPGGVNGTTIIDVVAPNGFDTKQYTIEFTVKQSDNCQLAGLAVNYESVEGFQPYYEGPYSLTLYSQDFTVQASKGEEHQTVEIDTDTDGKIIVRVTSQDESCQTVYTINYDIYKCSLSTLDNILLDGVGLEGFSPDVHTYSVVLPIGTTTPPALTVVTACDGQLVSTDAKGVKETSTIRVTSPDNSSTTTYSIFFDVELSDNCDLEAIYENGEVLPGFQTDVYYYEFDLPVGTRTFPELSYLTSDAGATVKQEDVYSTTYRRETRFFVTAENGTNKRTYIVVYNVAKSTVDVLGMIYLDDVPLDEFEPTRNSYSLLLPIGTKTLPVVTADKGDPYQAEPVIVSKSTSPIAITYTITATAEDGAQRVYTVDIEIELSTDNSLQSIYINGLPIEKNGVGYTANADFSPDVTDYVISWAVGTPSTPLPEIEAVLNNTETQKLYQSQPLTQLEGVVAFTVQNEKGDVRIYTVKSELLHSSVDTLAMITIDGADLEGYRGQITHYDVSLPVGTASFPTIGGEKALEWQTVEGPTLVSSDERTATYQLDVTAEAGNKRSYTVTFTIEQSACDTLRMIYLNNAVLADFDPHVNRYAVVLPHEADELPEITYDEGDAYQTIEVEMGALPGESYIKVKAQNGQVRIYTLYFSIAPSSESRLSMIYYDNQQVENFDADQTNYTIVLTYGTTGLPRVTYDKKEDVQTVERQLTDDGTQLVVTAEDGETQTIYNVKFTVALSSNALLSDIKLDDKSIDEFHPEQFDYSFELPYGTFSFPVVTWTTGDEQQTVAYLENEDGYTIIVTSGDGMTTNEYNIYFTVALSDENRLARLLINDTLIGGWDPDIELYELIYPVGTDSAELLTPDRVRYITIDPDATVTVSQSDLTITLTVIAPSGAVRVYVITQEILLSDNSLLADLMLDSVTIADFDPHTFSYRYELYEGQLPPEVTAVAQDTAAEVAVTMGGVGELTYIYCTAQDGSESVYSILFEITDINVNAEPNIGSCYFEHVPGTKQYKAVTICNNIQCSIYDFNGHLLETKDVEKVDPNKVTIGYNQTGGQVIFSVDADANGTLFEMPYTEQTYFYVFFTDGKKILSGKFALIE